MSINASGVLNTIQRDLFGLNRSVDMTTKGLNSLKIAAVGAMSALAGTEVLRGMWSLVDAGKELVHQQVLLRGAAIGTPILPQRPRRRGSWRTTWPEPMSPRT